jgi:hypothetical protein
MPRRHPSREQVAVAHRSPDGSLDAFGAIVEADAPSWKAVLMLSGSSIAVAAVISVFLIGWQKASHDEIHKALDNRIDTQAERISHVSDDIHEIKSGLRVVWAKTDVEAMSKLKPEPDAGVH